MLFDEIEKIVGYLEVDFLITIREQKEFLASNYAGSYPVFKSAMFNFKEVDTFNRFIEKGLLNKYDNWIGSLFYLNEIEKYENSGMGKVKVMVYEDFRDNPSGFLMELFGFIGSAADPLKYMKQPRQNVSTVDDKHVYYDGNYIVSLFAKIYRLFSLEQSGQLRFVVDRLKYVVQKKNVVEYTDDQIMILDDLYRENNKKLSEKYALDLGKKGYAV